MVWISIFFVIITVPLSLFFGTAALLCLPASVLCLVASCYVNIPSGHVGVQVLMGRVLDNALPEGLQRKHPLVHIHNMSVRDDSYTMARQSSVKALSKDGLSMSIDVTINYRLLPHSAPWVYQRLGTDLVATFLRPAVRAAVRDIASGKDAASIWDGDRQATADAMRSQAGKKMDALLRCHKDCPIGGAPFLITTLLLRNVELPRELTEAIEAKYKAEQAALAMEFAIKKEKQEAERKGIEAKGIDLFQKTVAQDLTPDLLKWKGIAATEKLAASKNTKVIVIGSGKDGLPLILGGE